MPHRAFYSIFYIMPILSDNTLEIMIYNCFLFLILQVQFRRYEDVGHVISDDELVDLMNWVQDILHMHSPGALRPSYSKEDRASAAITSDIALQPQSLPYVIEAVPGGNNAYLVYFSAPESLVDMLTARQVLARGSCFDIQPAEVLFKPGQHIL